jgi:hypothetical protein
LNPIDVTCPTCGNCDAHCFDLNRLEAYPPGIFHKSRLVASGRDYEALWRGLRLENEPPYMVLAKESTILTPNWRSR